MSCRRATGAAAFALGVLLATPAAALTIPASVAPPYLSTPDTTLVLARFIINSTSCTNPSPQGSGCVSGDGVPNPRLRLDQRVKAPFHGTVTLTVPDNTEAVFIGYGRQRSIEYTARPTIDGRSPAAARTTCSSG
jgi:hypothetical protein